MLRTGLMSIVIVILVGTAPSKSAHSQPIPAEGEAVPRNAVLPIGTLPVNVHPLPAQVRALALDSGEIVELRYAANGPLLGHRSLSIVRRAATGQVEARADDLPLVRNATLATDGERVVVAWQAARSDGLSAVFMRLYDRGLVPLSGVVQVSGTSDANRYAPALAVNADQVLVTFEASPPITEDWLRTSLFARRFDWQARPIGSAFKVDAPPVNDLERGVENVHPLLLASGEAVIAWADHSGGESSLGDVHMAAFDLSGPVAVQTLEERIVGFEHELPLSQWPLALIGLNGGGYVVVWETRALWPRAQIFDVGHLPRTKPFPLLQSEAAGFPDNRSLRTMDGVPLADGGFVVSWQGGCFDGPQMTCPDPVLDPLEDYYDGSGLGTFVRSFDGGGNALGPSRLLHPEVEGSQVGFLLPSARHLGGNGLNLASVPALFNASFREENDGFLRFLAPPCASDADTACTGLSSRFRIEARWRDFSGGEGRALVQQQEEAWASFSFFDPGQIDLVVKIVDARSFVGNHWIFFSSLSDVFFELSVLDTATGLSRVYRNESGVFASRGDTVGLPEIDPPDQDVVGQPSRAPGMHRGDAPSPPVPADQAASREGCVVSSTRLCFFDRFAAEVAWTDFQGGTGVGQELELSGDSQAFWFFDPSNPELTLKVLDGTAINGSYWVFFGSLSNVGFNLEITDLETGAVRSWTNEAGTFASVGDVNAFKLAP